MRTYRNPLVDVPGLEPGAVAGRDDHIGLEREWGAARGAANGAELDVGLGELAGGVEPLAVGDRDLGPFGSEIVQADPAVAVLPEVDDVATRRDLGHRHRRQLLDAADGRPDRRAQLGAP